MKRGFNTTLSMYRKLNNFPEARVKLAIELLDLDSRDRVLRYPDGQESLNNNYIFDDQDTINFLQFCDESNVSQVCFRASFQDVSGSVRTYELLSDHLDVILVEASNEPYNAENMKARTRHERRLAFQEFLFGWLGVFPFTNYKSLKYCDETLALLNAFESNGHMIRDKFAFSLKTPRDRKSSIWLENSKLKFHSLKIANFHLYGNDNTQFVTNTSNLIKSRVGSRWRKVSTEFNGLHFGAHGSTNYVEHAFEALHKANHNAYLALFETNNFEIALLHNLVGADSRRKFPRYILDFNVASIIDRMKDFS